MVSQQLTTKRGQLRLVETSRFFFLFICQFFLNKHKLVILLNKNKPLAGYKHVFKSANSNYSDNSREPIEISRTQAGSPEISKNGWYLPLRNLTAMTTHFQPDCRGSTERALVWWLESKITSSTYQISRRKLEKWSMATSAEIPKEASRHCQGLQSLIRKVSWLSIILNPLLTMTFFIQPSGDN